MNWREKTLATRLIHAGDPSPRIQGAVSIPIVQSTVFEFHEPKNYDDIPYPRLTNLANHIALGEKLASLEQGEVGMVTASGMAAISTTLLALLKGGGHLLAQRTLYGGTLTFANKYLPELGVTVDFIDGNDPDSWRKLLKPNTRVIYTEALTNPTLELADHRAAVSFAKEHNLTSVIDNTFATPINFRPLDLGYDIALHSASKYLNGHSDLAAGAIISTKNRVREIKGLLNELGGALDPHSCFLLNRGLKTLESTLR